MTIPEEPAKTDDKPAKPQAGATIHRLGLWKLWCVWRNRKRKGVMALATALPPAHRQTGFVLLALGLGWGFQAWTVLAEDTLSGFLIVTAILAAPFLAAMAVGRRLKKTGDWMFAFGLLNLVCSLFVLMFRFMVNQAPVEEAVLVSILAVAIYLVAFWIHIRTVEQSIHPEGRPFGALPDQVRRWLPTLLPLLFLGVELALMHGTRLLKHAGELAGIEIKERAVLILPPQQGGGETLWLPAGWNTFATSFHFGPLDVLCDEPGGPCYLVREGGDPFHLPERPEVNRKTGEAS